MVKTNLAKPYTEPPPSVRAPSGGLVPPVRYVTYKGGLGVNLQSRGALELYLGNILLKNWVNQAGPPMFMQARDHGS
jgi:hypothetical protein